MRGAGGERGRLHPQEEVAQQSGRSGGCAGGTEHTAGQRWARAVPGEPWSGTAGGTERERVMEREALAVRDPGTTTGVGLSVWKLVLALQGDRDT